MTFAQIGLGDPTGGIIVLMIFAALAVLGLIIGVVSAVVLAKGRGARWKPGLSLFAGLLLMSPALWFAWVMFVPETPRDMAWDFSADRSIAQLKDEKPAGSDFYFGNIRSTIKLDSGRHWSGHAYLIVIRVKSEQLRDIQWQSVSESAEPIYERTRRILKGLELPDRDLQAWYEKVRRGEQASFSAVSRSDSGASVEVQVRGFVAEKYWTTHVNVRWPEGNR